MLVVLLELLDLVNDALVGVTLEPDVGPVAVFREITRNDVDHESEDRESVECHYPRHEGRSLSRIDFLGEINALLGKVVGQLLDLAKVHSASALLEEKHAIEFSKDGGGGLMNRAQDGLTGGGELAQECDDEVRGLTVETGSRLVEEQQSWLGDEFDTDGETLASFNSETSCGATSESQRS